MPADPLALDPSRLQLTERDIERRKAFVDLQSDDVVRITQIKELVLTRANVYAAAFFDHLANLPEGATFVNMREVLGEAKRLKHEHLIAMVGGEYGKQYVEQRIRLGTLYAEAGLEVRVFMGAYHHLMRAIGLDIMKQFQRDPVENFQTFMSLKKLGFLDIGVIVDVIIAERERIIALQQEAIRELSTPVLQLRDRLLILPIIGLLDSQRARQLTDSLLHAIRTNRAKIVVMDITGVGAVDSKVANHLIQTVAAARLMGTRVIVTGMSAEVAQALVTLGVELSTLGTSGDLRGGLEEAERSLGYWAAPLEDSEPEPLQA
jgi:rsbT co-antagonist protein RsbR